MSQEIIDQARVLSELIAKSDELIGLRDSQAKMGNDPVAQEIIALYTGAQNNARNAKQEGRELSAAELENYDSIEKQIEKNSTILQYIDAEEKFSALMEGINFLIMKAVNGQASDDCDPKGGCSSCSGCGGH